ncbi:hypothetical protein Cgig2_028364 [Carnegiea gigantea]|uniref:F-box associated beta-propeller type 1 domain-containing protein n=1 Tax=Carnegiea gigantea TaxID=171969 RepID=A0A9Q1QAL9_9CARY|nr:hypothetical protein Cgig2_028364 [Carnegiea gigantea]
MGFQIWIILSEYRMHMSPWLDPRISKESDAKGFISPSISTLESARLEMSLTFKFKEKADFFPLRTRRRDAGLLSSRWDLAKLWLEIKLFQVLHTDLNLPRDLAGTRRISPPLGSCHGFICFDEANRRIPKPMCVLNPITKEFSYIPLPNGYHKTAGKWASGLGFVTSFNDYKIVLLEQTLHSSKNITCNRVDVFSFRDDQWRGLDSSVGNFDASVDGSLNEALYWVVWSFLVDHLLNLTWLKRHFLRATSIKEIRDAETRNMYYDRHASIGVIAQKYMCVGQVYSVQSGERFLEMWMMEKYSELNRLFRLGLESEIVGRFPGLLGITPNGIRYAPKKQEIFLLDPGRIPPMYVVVAQKYVHHVMSYIPSLVSPCCVGRSVNE